MNKNAWKAWFVLMVFTAGTSMVSPLLPLYQEEFGLSNGAVVLVFVIYTFAVTPSMLALGNLADQAGRKTVIWPAMLVLTFASLLLAGAPGPFALYLGRVLQGLALGAFLGNCTAYIVDLAESSQKARAGNVLPAPWDFDRTQTMGGCGEPAFGNDTAFLYGRTVAHLCGSCANNR